MYLTHINKYSFPWTFLFMALICWQLQGNLFDIVSEDYTHGLTAIRLKAFNKHLSTVIYDHCYYLSKHVHNE